MEQINALLVKYNLNLNNKQLDSDWVESVKDYQDKINDGKYKDNPESQIEHENELIKDFWDLHRVDDSKDRKIQTLTESLTRLEKQNKILKAQKTQYAYNTEVKKVLNQIKNANEISELEEIRDSFDEKKIKETAQAKIDKIKNEQETEKLKELTGINKQIKETDDISKLEEIRDAVEDESTKERAQAKIDVIKKDQEQQHASQKTAEQQEKQKIIDMKRLNVSQMIELGFSEKEINQKLNSFMGDKNFEYKGLFLEKVAFLKAWEVNLKKSKI